MPITLVAAISQNNCIGKNGTLPWHIPADFKRLQEITIGKVIIMGRRTWESIPPKRRPLPRRTNVVITRESSERFPSGVEIFATINDALAAHSGEDIIGFGGQKIFEEMMPLADRLEITHVHQTVESGDAFFPPIDTNVWIPVWQEDHADFSFVTYKKTIKNK